ncbi:MAG: hypothetical protein AB7G06_09465 [Bdellovibrionales bacterium]
MNKYQLEAAYVEMQLGTGLPDIDPAAAFGQIWTTDDGTGAYFLLAPYYADGMDKPITDLCFIAGFAGDTYKTMLLVRPAPEGQIDTLARNAFRADAEGLPEYVEKDLGAAAEELRRMVASHKKLAMHKITFDDYKMLQGQASPDDVIFQVDGNRLFVAPLIDTAQRNFTRTDPVGFGSPAND